ncbi:MAG TPA: ABC transporter permease subunit [Caldilineaceae bacterium]|nr:ABC transporter permease subunit [Caldilineaceae bacterium]
MTTVTSEIPSVARIPTRPSLLRVFWNYARENWMLFLLALPGVALIFAVRYIPMFGVVIAFENFHPRTGFFSPWVGLSNFQLLWNSPVVLRLVRNTILLNVMFLVATTIFSVLVALLINEVQNRWFKKVSQSVMFLPFFMGWSVVSMILFGLLDPEFGTINKLLMALGYAPATFMTEPWAWPWILTITRVWRDTGTGCIIYLPVLTGISQELYEAAAIDGASRWQRMARISLPLLVPSIILITLLAIGNIFFGDFGMIYAIVQERANLYPTTDVIDTYIIRALQSSMNFGMSTAVGLSQSVLGFIFVFGSNWLVKWYSRRRGEDYSLF